ncbi:hypothetical protein TDB9533_01338 [Thalassocella blandensis]|nr:hypothetical protein TDB9533_01338 [Thalassocella blandensis]
MALLDSDTVDAISINSEGEVVLSVIDELPWDENKHLVLLQDKINAYIRFVESGEILDSYPKAKGKSIVFKVISKFEIDESGMDFINKLKPILSDINIAIRYELFDLNS